MFYLQIKILASFYYILKQNFIKFYKLRLLAAALHFFCLKNGKGFWHNIYEGFHIFLLIIHLKPHIYKLQKLKTKRKSVTEVIIRKNLNMTASSLGVFPPPLASSNMASPPHVGQGNPLFLSTVHSCLGYFLPYFFYIFTFTNLLWTLWTLWTYRDLLVKQLQRLKSDNKSVHSTVHGTSQL